MMSCTGVVGTSLKFHESTIEESKEAIATVKAWWKKRFEGLNLSSTLYQLFF